jgi:hypothetical protein
MNTLPEIRERMVQLLGHADKLSFINARLVLRTGVSLTLDAHCSPDDVTRVKTALQDMGYVLDAPAR